MLRVFVGLFFATLVHSMCGVWFTVALLDRGTSMHFRRRMLFGVLIVGLPATG